MRLFPFAAFLCALLASAPESAGQQAKEILVGASLSATGKYAQEGQHVRNGYDLAVKMVNRKNRIRIGDKVYHLRVRYYDDASETQWAEANATRLAGEDGVGFLLGPYSSTLTRAVQAVAEKHRIPLVQANGGARFLRSERNRFHFAVLSTADRDMAGIVDLFHELAVADGSMSPLSAALIFQQDAYSQDVRLGAMERLVHHGIHLAVDDIFPDTLDDISESLAKVKALKPDLLLISGHAKGAATAVRQLDEFKIDVPMVAVTQCDSARIIEVSPMGAEHVICPTQWHADLPYEDEDSLFGSGKDFARLFWLEYDYYPPYHAAESAAAVQVLADAIVQAGSVNPDAVRDALAKTDFKSFFGAIRFDETGSNIAKDSVIMQVIDGKFVLINPSENPVAKTVYPRLPGGGQ